MQYEEEDVYQILGVDPTADDAEILKVYRRLVMENHPDKGGDPAVMAKINKAYSRIKTPELRKEYEVERSGNEFTVKFKWMEKVFGESHVAENFGQAPVDDRSGIRGSDIELVENIPMEWFVLGRSDYALKYTKTNECRMCNGTGHAKSVACNRCGGTGKITFRKKTKDCPKCEGTGVLYSGECEVCHGEKAFTKECVHTFDYQPGTESIVFPGKGNEGIEGGPNGDLKISFNPLDDEGLGLSAYMSPDGFPFLSFTREVPVEDFILGSKVDFNLYGKLVVVSIPFMTAAGDDGFAYTWSTDNLINGLHAVFNFYPAREQAPLTEQADGYRAVWEAVRKFRNESQPVENDII